MQRGKNIAINRLVEGVGGDRLHRCPPPMDPPPVITKERWNGCGAICIRNYWSKLYDVATMEGYIFKITNVKKLQFINTLLLL